MNHSPSKNRKEKKGNPDLSIRIVESFKLSGAKTAKTAVIKVTVFLSFLDFES